ncbi:flagellar biosynthesis protein FlhF [bacterium]|nr:flagellar biosynthesis protein FlhF [bacterium]MBU0899663.1 flagellar biosynthesis protein FlhF [bacterium]MBU1152352.1 flagellar biosynthesis protein FlhF [bacterium]MBU1782693.1 flagellar biosynthesis protein FlhF [bacterium]
MLYKTYEAETLQKAILLKEIDYGDRAKVISHRLIRKGGFWGLFGRKMVELTCLVPPIPPGLLTSKNYFNLTNSQNIPKAKEDNDKITLIQKELETIKENIEGITEEKKQLKYPGKIGSLYKKLVQNDIEPELAERLIDRVISEVPAMQIDNGEYLKSRLISYLSTLIKIEGAFPLNGGGPKIIALVGTTGVGKTTTLAKLAANFVFNKKKKVSLITIDTYRIAAVEQLRTFAEIINLPLKVVFGPLELKKAIDESLESDLILIDTAGRSQRNDMQMQELKNFFQGVNYNIEKFLLLSATTKYKDLLNMVRSFKKVSFDKIILTKIDEAITIGPMINLLTKIPQALVYITTGQNVPEDMVEAINYKLVESIFDE